MVPLFTPTRRRRRLIRLRTHVPPRPGILLDNPQPGWYGERHRRSVAQHTSHPAGAEQHWRPHVASGFDEVSVPRLVVAGAGSHTGKTGLTAGIIAALRRRGL